MERALRWTNEVLFRALSRYERECISSGMRPQDVHSYWDYARRFLKGHWRTLSEDTLGYVGSTT